MDINVEKLKQTYSLNDKGYEMLKGEAKLIESQYS